MGIEKRFLLTMVATFVATMGGMQLMSSLPIWVIMTTIAVVAHAYNSYELCAKWKFVINDKKLPKDHAAAAAATAAAKKDAHANNIVKCIIGVCSITASIIFPLGMIVTARGSEIGPFVVLLSWLMYVGVLAGTSSKASIFLVPHVVLERK